MRPLRLSIAVCVVLLGTVMAGCVVPMLPAPQASESPRRQLVFDHLDEVVVPGQTTTTDVLRRLGEPDYRAIGDRAFLYVWSDQATGFVVGVPLPVPLSVRPVQSKAILIRFDAGGVVSSATKSLNDQNCFGMPDAEMIYCSGRPDEPVNWQRVVETEAVDTTSDILSASDESVREVFFVAAYRLGADWVHVAVVVSSRSVIVVDRAGKDTPYNRVLATLARAQIVEVRLTEDSESPSVAALIVLADGRHVALAFGSLRAGAAQAPFDRQRTQLFIDTVRELIAIGR